MRDILLIIVLIVAISVFTSSFSSCNDFSHTLDNGGLKAVVEQIWQGTN